MSFANTGDKGMTDIPKGRANRKKPTRPRSRTLLREGWIQSSGRSSDSGAREILHLSPTATASHISRYSAWAPSVKWTARVAFVLQYRCASAPDSHRIPYSSAWIIITTYRQKQKLRHNIWAHLQCPDDFLAPPPWQQHNKIYLV